MIDLKFIRNFPFFLDRSLILRGEKKISKQILNLDICLRQHVKKLQDLQYQSNKLIKEISYFKLKGKNITQLISKALQIKKNIFTIEKKNRYIYQFLNDIIESLPNILFNDLPIGLKGEEGLEIRNWGIHPSINNPKKHFEIGEFLGQMNFKLARKMSGSRFVVLLGNLARLERALTSFMLDIHTKKFGYIEVSPPVLVSAQALFGTGQLPKFSEDLFQTIDGRWLIPTSEVSLTNLVREKILSEEELPLRFCAHTPCFRLEAGSAGKDTQGMIRQHQFSKVEIVSITTPHNSFQEHGRMIQAAEKILQELNLSYRVTVLRSTDTGSTSKKTYDLEVWLPGNGCYREISSCSIIGDYQSRRMRSTFKSKAISDGIHYVHTLNASGVAVGRALVAVIENYQQTDGTVIVPDVLRPYMNGLKVINP